jgi:hypothetical protein
MAINYNSTFSAENTLACRNNGTEIEARGRNNGAYVGKAVETTTTTICEAEGFSLQKVESVGVKYQIIWDGELLNRYPSLKDADAFFIDFTGMTKAKYAKAKAKFAA